MTKTEKISEIKSKLENMKRIEKASQHPQMKKVYEEERKELAKALRDLTSSDE